MAWWFTARRTGSSDCLHYPSFWAPHALETSRGEGKARGSGHCPTPSLHIVSRSWAPSRLSQEAPWRGASFTQCRAQTSGIWVASENSDLTQPLSTDRGKRATRSDAHKQHLSLYLCSQMQGPEWAAKKETTACLFHLNEGSHPFPVEGQCP